MIKLVKPDKKYEDEMLSFKEEFLSNDEHSIPGSELFDKMDSFDDWLDYVSKNSSPLTVSNDWVVTSTFLALIDDEVVGTPALIQGTVYCVFIRRLFQNACRLV